MSDRAFSHWWHRVSSAFVRLVEGAPSVGMLPRAKTHWLTLEVRGIPSRFFASSLRLQLRQFLGLDAFSFAYSVTNGVASVWYWLEADESVVGSEGRARIEPWPEALLRSPVADGVHLIRCRSGVEAMLVRNRSLVRTRWFSAVPTSDVWDAFARDAGLDPAVFPMPSLSECKQVNAPPREWRVSSRQRRSLSGAAWGGVGLAALLGLAIVIGGAISLKLSAALSIEKENLQKLVKERSVTIALLRDLDEKRTYLEGFSGLREAYSQLELIESLIDAGVLSEKEKISLAEWEFKNGRLRLLFSVPQENFSLGLFLSVLEKQPMVKELSLMPDTPAGTVGVQLMLASPGMWRVGVGDTSRQTDLPAPLSTP